MADDPSSSAAIQAAPDKTAPAAQVDLRPLTTSELIDRGFTLYRAHFAGFLLLALLCQIAPLVSQVLITITGIAPTVTDLMDNPYGCLSRVGVMLIIMFVAQLIVFGFEVLLTFYIADACLGKIPSVRNSMRKFATRVWASVWTFALSRALISLTLIFPFLVVAAAYLYAVKYPPVEFFFIAAFAMVGILLFIASLVPVLVVFMRIWVIIPPLAIERLSGWKAVGRSVELVRYDPGLGILYWGEMRLSFLLLPLFAIELLILSLTSLPLIIVDFSEAVRHGAAQLNAPPDATMMASTVLAFLAESLVLPLYPIATTLFYYDVRIRREGFDLEFMAENLRSINA
ncbi:MAG TPA: hypothetical protein VL981_14095 [Candidatus Methylacidiphilales bacterium]|nr:hypothetical protein [Candidatus Methylacidiphilales bacterium]